MAPYGRTHPSFNYAGLEMAYRQGFWQVETIDSRSGNPVTHNIVGLHFPGGGEGSFSFTVKHAITGEENCLLVYPWYLDGFTHESRRLLLVITNINMISKKDAENNRGYARKLTLDRNSYGYVWTRPESAPPGFPVVDPGATYGLAHYAENVRNGIYRLRTSSGAHPQALKKGDRLYGGTIVLSEPRTGSDGVTYVHVPQDGNKMGEWLRVPDRLELALSTVPSYK